MKKILYIATTADSRNRLDGETIKCRLLKEYLKEQENVKIYSVDTDNWKKHVIKLVFQILFYFLLVDDIIVSSADRGAHIVLNFFEKIKCKKNIYYFVIGGSLCRNINEKKWDVKTYKNIKKIYVEANTLKDNLKLLGLENVEKLNNFRKVEKFENKYEKTNKIKFVYYGRVIKEKGIEEAIKLILKLINENIECTLDIYGQCTEEYLKNIQKYFNENIRYHGEIKPNNKDEYEELSKYDIFIFPTEYPGECLPGALIDAYISGLAVIASNWQYAKEYIEENKNGIIFEYKNYEDMYLKTKEFVCSGKLAKFKEESLNLAKEYLIDYILKDFVKKIY